MEELGRANPKKEFPQIKGAPNNPWLKEMGLPQIKEAPWVKKYW